MPGRQGLLSYLFDLDVSPADGFADAFRFIAYTVDLKGDETTECHVVLQNCRWNSVQPGFDGRPDGLNLEVIPFALAEGLLRRRAILEIEEPSSTSFVIDSACPGTIRRIDFDLIAVDPPRRDFPLPYGAVRPLDLDVRFLFKYLAANLDS